VLAITAENDKGTQCGFILHFFTTTAYSDLMALCMSYYLLYIVLYCYGHPADLTSCGFFFFLSFFSLPNLSGRRVDVYHTSTIYTWCGLSANLECRSEMCCTQLTGNTGRKNDAKNRHLRTIAQLCQAVSLQLRHVLTIGKKNLLNSNMFSICLRNMANFGLLMAEIGSGVWCTLANFNRFHVLALLLHRCHSLEANQTWHNVWLSPGLVHYIYILEGYCPW